MTIKAALVLTALATGILPVTQSRNRIVPDLTADGYKVRYDEFEGGHTIPSGIAGGALDWFIG